MLPEKEDPNAQGILDLCHVQVWHDGCFDISQVHPVDIIAQIQQPNERDDPLVNLQKGKRKDPSVRGPFKASAR